MAKQKLTQAFVQRDHADLFPAATPPTTAWIPHWDTKTPGFGLRVTRDDARAYIVGYRVRGSRAHKIKTIGKTAVFDLEQARERAKEVLREAESGRDWFKTVALARALTIGAVWEHYRDEHLADKEISPRTREDAELLWKKHCEKAFKGQAVVDVTAPSVRAWHRDITEYGPYVANRSLQLMRAAFNYGVRYGKIPAGLANPFAMVDLNAEHARQVILLPEQFPALAEAIDALPDPYGRAYLWLMFYTGARRTELATLTWENVSLGEKPTKAREVRKGTVTFGKTKNGQPFKVELSAPAVEILESLPNIEGNPFVFVGRVEGTHLDPKPHWAAVRKAAKLPELRLHDLRRSFGSWLAASGYSSKQIGAALNHRSDVTAAVYMQLGANVTVKRTLADAHAKLAKDAIEQAKKPKAVVASLEDRRIRG